MLASWTGHRPYYFADPVAARERVGAEARELARQYPESLWFLTGGQRGVDLWAAASADHLGIPFEVILPLPTWQFCREWPTPEVEELTRLLGRAARVRVVDPDGNTGQAAYTRRDYLLAEECQLLVAVWTGVEFGGTWETVSFARELTKPIRDIRLPGSGWPVQPGQRGI